MTSTLRGKIECSGRARGRFHSLSLLLAARVSASEPPRARRRSSTPPAASSPPTSAAHRLEGAAVVGHGLGGDLALSLAETEPGLVSAVAIVDAYPFLPAARFPGAMTARARDAHPDERARALQEPARAPIIRAARAGWRRAHAMTSARSPLSFFTGSLAFTAAGLVAAAGLGMYYRGTAAGVASTVFITAVLAVLEISLSFDNAVVNATVLRDMTPVWRHRFLTWGIAIAVFGMRLVFPLLVVSVVARIGPWEALRLATLRPHDYARILTSAHVVIGAFGGAFLGMVSLRYFFDSEKMVHWLRPLERGLSRLGKVEAAELALMLLVLYGISRAVPAAESEHVLVAGIFGIVTFIAVDGIGAAMEVDEAAMATVHRASAASFLYLEVLDASFSFDGVIGAFALTNNLFVIALGLGIGAMFVRSLTVMLVERGTLASYRFLEHGAFYAIGALAAIMLVGTFVDVPEAVTGLVGAAFIGLSVWSSIRWNRRAARTAPDAEA
ncbi:DUF475 domain-containing protein [Anaeromyxobacter oryzae]|uniref:DUF475 domain-containing protein n=1 Tax=Anaeromyxobacter oryzae TaxID=2918170 RepID=A0ABN6MSY5_9BACT|nr:DUF475 domain-containing protein [Anaeromyxobacter oryzae]BDG04082.1 hypothetical protein AMOR_30780 [Anaeromyxobacter oryzae]